jgi:acyl-CoA synthetase (AMP-forming)/AMP-acid ligase II
VRRLPGAGRPHAAPGSSFAELGVPTTLTQLVVEERLKELIKVDGVQVAPAELELLLGQHPAVRDAAVVGRPDPEAGEVPVAYVVLLGPAIPDELIAFTAPRLAAHKRPRDVRIFDQLPRMPSGKLQRHLLRDRERHAAAARARAQRS